jgi:hypothetical protein
MLWVHISSNKFPETTNHNTSTKNTTTDSRVLLCQLTSIQGPILFVESLVEYSNTGSRSIFNIGNTAVIPYGSTEISDNDSQFNIK